MKDYEKAWETSEVRKITDEPLVDYLECPRCKEIELRPINADEYECENCGHYELGADYDPTPDEPGEPPVTERERGIRPR